jgi:DNA-binding NarL/FixJ family response regulator
MRKIEVLIVEDEVLLAMEYEVILRDMGYSVLRAAFSGHDAVLLSSQYRPDIVLMDIKIDGSLNGINAARQIQEGLNIPVLFITGHADEETRKKAHEINPAGYLTKPLDEGELRETLENILNSK